MTEYRVCTKCWVPHFENCGTCFGFGVLKRRTADGVIPVAAGEAFHITTGEEVLTSYRCTSLDEVEPCPECGSDVNGIKTGAGDD